MTDELMTNEAEKELDKIIQPAWAISSTDTSEKPNSDRDFGVSEGEFPTNYENTHEIYPDPNAFEVKKEIGRLG